MIDLITIQNITIFVLAIFIGWMGIDTWQGGLIVGLLTAVGFSANTAFVKDRFEARPISLSLINASHDIVILGLMGLIIGMWQ